MRNLWVDYAKAIGIFLVVYGHVAIGIHKAGLPIEEDFFQIVNSVIYSFHMPLFFFLSGVFFYDSYTRRGALGLTFNKVDSILYPYVIWSILQGTIEVVMSGYTNGGLTFAEVFSFAWYPRAQFWFLYTLFVIFVISVFLFRVFNISRLVWFLMFFGALYLLGGYFQMPRVLSFISDSAFFFLFGIWFFSADNARLGFSYLRLIFLFGAFFCGQFIFHSLLGLTYVDVGMASLCLAVISILFIVELSRVLSFVSVRWVAYIGVYSMSIYLMHIIAGSGVRVVLVRLFDVQSPFIHLVSGVFVGIVAPVFGYLVIKRYGLGFLLAPPAFISCEFNYLRKRSGM